MAYRLTTSNLDWATGPVKDRPAVDHLAAFSDVLFFQEAKNLRFRRASLRGMLGPEWSTLHQIATPARAGSALAVHKASGLPFRGTGLWWGADSRVTLPRWLAHGTTVMYREGVELISAHDFPRYANRHDPGAQERFLRRLKHFTDAAHRRGHGWVVGMDANVPIGHVGDLLNGRSFGDGIIGFATSYNVHVGAHGADWFGKRHGETDHPAYWIDVVGASPAHR